ncbi:uncharacterized protein TRIADDRAFT_58904 [Trichoplax adhaerens]|uniref:Uncharacterized protein n=1 Tax=Trichoplax adhaerens TaxID=10228 RepID=B3S400_TRIAD|nr:predicted protein [Trichoplax adhaerens]EDV22369.1 predicted protein [Trichoplax adhaerens]|eukprot:XP_002114913.1 predicted protein [Trichoplax adhaerens]
MTENIISQLRLLSKLQEGIAVNRNSNRQRAVKSDQISTDQDINMIDELLDLQYYMNKRKSDQKELPMSRLHILQELISKLELGARVRHDSKRRSSVPCEYVQNNKGREGVRRANSKRKPIVPRKFVQHDKEYEIFRSFKQKSPIPVKSKLLDDPKEPKGVNKEGGPSKPLPISKKLIQNKFTADSEEYKRVRKEGGSKQTPLTLNKLIEDQEEPERIRKESRSAKLLPVSNKLMEDPEEPKRIRKDSRTTLRISSKLIEDDGSVWKSK